MTIFGVTGYGGFVFFALLMALWTGGVWVWLHRRHVMPLQDQYNALLRQSAEWRLDGVRLLERTGQLATLQERHDVLLGRLRQAETAGAEMGARFEALEKMAAEKESAFLKARQELESSFKALSADALQNNARQFLQLAKLNFDQLQEGARHDLEKRHVAFQEIVTPIRQALTGVDAKLADLEKNRTVAYEGLNGQVRDLIAAQKELRLETGNLVKALRAPHVRGRWGEMQLRRVVEMSGMSPHCDFLEQSTVGEENRLRPDMIVYLPSKKRLVIDAKAPLAAYLDGVEEGDDGVRTERMRTYARHVRTHIMALSGRQYWDQFSEEETPEFVVMFLPADPFLNTALAHDPTLLEMGVERKVILATPSTLIALLHAIAYGWRSESLEQNAKEISTLGRDLYKRLSDMAGHFSRLGQSLSGAMKAYNSTVGSLESRVLPSARRFKDLNAAFAQDDLAVLASIHQDVRPLLAPELMPLQGDDDVNLAKQGTHHIG